MSHDLGYHRNTPINDTAVSATISAERPQLMSEADCHEVLHRVARFANGGGYTAVGIASTWVGNVRWARNQISTAGEVRNNDIGVNRDIQGAEGWVAINDTTDEALVGALRRAERALTFDQEQIDPERNLDLLSHLPLEPVSAMPQLFSESTYQLDADRRSAAAIALAEQAAASGMLSAGYIEVAAIAVALMDTVGRTRYCSYTQAQYSVTVRHPQGIGSGWAGETSYDWHTLDPTALTARALEKCLRSLNPVAIEPGRYMTILEPQATSDFVGKLLRVGVPPDQLDRYPNESYDSKPFFKDREWPSHSKLGEKVMDERLTIRTDPADPEVGYPPFWTRWNAEPADNSRDVFNRNSSVVYHPTTWIKNGVLINLAYHRFESSTITALGRDENFGMPNSGAFRMSGGDTSVDEMIATTKRGLLVTRFDRVERMDERSQTYRGYTRDGLWLIENGKISKAVKNMVFVESIFFALNNVEQLGPPKRVFVPNIDLGVRIPQPAIVPPLKINDFSFTALTEAI